MVELDCTAQYAAPLAKRGATVRKRPTQQPQSSILSDMKRVPTDRTWDSIIIGGGSSGCVAARELSADPNAQVLLIEAGRDTPPEAEPKEILDPYYAPAMVPRNFWPGLEVGWTAASSIAPERPPVFYEQGRIMGGGSSVNSMVAIRAIPGDFAEWSARGLSGWRWDDVLPYFIAVERDLDFDGPLHGRSGPIPIRRHRREEWPRFCQAVAEAAAATGLPFVDDMNGDFRDGYARVPMSNTPERRVSAAAGFLDAATRARRNLTIASDCRVRRILFEGRRVRGVEIQGPEGPVALAARRVILCAGALRSPSLLQLSGIGDPALLGRLGIPTVIDRPGVGRGLQEHPTVALAAFLRSEARQSPSLRAHANLALRITSPEPGSPASNIYAAVIAKSSWHPIGQRLGNILISLHRPLSRGEVAITSADPLIDPKVMFRVLDHEQDRRTFAFAVRHFWSLLHQPGVRRTFSNAFLASYSPFVQSLNRYSFYNRVRSGLAATALDASGPLLERLVEKFVCAGLRSAEIVADDRLLDRWMLENATGFFHPTGTCAMGPASDREAVVSETGQLIGAEGLYVMDASIMPQIIRANTNLTTMAIALKLSRELGKRS
jgi:5-(hydroxymethyl)furfural/furfural oxidase